MKATVEPCLRGDERVKAAFEPRRGAAMLIAILVLTALFLLALPFAVFMRLQHTAGTQALQNVRARYGESGGLSHARAVLYAGLEPTETRRRDDQIAEFVEDVFPFHEPTVDTLYEFRATLRTTSRTLLGDDDEDRDFEVEDALGFPNDGDAETLDGYIRVEDEWLGYYHVDVDTSGSTFPRGRLTVRDQSRGLFGTLARLHNPGSTVSFFPELEIWHLDIADEQAKINVNTAPYQVIVNLLGYLGIPGGSAPAPGDAAFPSGAQRVIASAISGYRLYYSYWENDDDGDGVETPAEDNIPDGSYTRFQNLNAVKNISAAPWFTSSGGWAEPLSAEDFDRLRPYITVHSEPPAGGIWQDFLLALDTDINGSAAGRTELWAARLLNASSVPVGVMMALEYGDQHDYRMVTSVCRGDVTFVDDIGAVFTGAVEVSDVSGFTLLQTTIDPLNEPHTPGYLYIEEGAAGEWIAFSYVDPATNEIHISERQLWDSDSVDPGPGTSLRGHTVGWRHDSGQGFSSNVSDLDWVGNFAMSVTDTYPEAAGVMIERRHAINVNTVMDPIVLASILHGIRDDADDIDATEAGNAALAFLDRTSGAAGGPPYEFFDGDEDWFEDRTELEAFLAELDTPLNVVDAGDAGLLQGNFETDDPADNWPAVSTVPLRLNSGDLVGIESLCIVDDRALTPVAQSPMVAQGRVYVAQGRVYDTVPPLEDLYWALRTQREFYDYMTGSSQTEPLGAHIYTTPLKEDLPEPMRLAEDDYEDPSWGIGAVAPSMDMAHPYYQLETDTPLYTTAVFGLHESPPSFNLDYSIAGNNAMTGGATRDASNTTPEGTRDVHLQYSTRYGEPAALRHIEADSFDATIQPLTVEFWMRPAETDPDPQLIVDVGQGADPEEYSATSQVRVYMQDDELVLRIDEPMFKQAGGYGGYVEARSSVAFEPGDWHYVAIVAVGTFREEIAMFVDGIYDEDMAWTYHYLDAAGALQTADEASVAEGAFMPVALALPDQNTFVTVGPHGTGDPADPGYWHGDEFGGGDSEIGLSDVSWLPERGWVVIGGAEQAYAYDGFGTESVYYGGGVWDTVSTIMLRDASGAVDTLKEPHDAGELVALMIPVARTTRHTEAAYSVPPDTVVLVAHTEVNAGNESYEVGPETLLVMGSVRSFDPGAFPTAPEVDDYVWLGVDPDEFPLGDADDVLTHADRYKGLVYYPNGVLAGSLPTGPLGGNFSFGADRDGEAAFTGELDELRIGAAPIALVKDEGWSITDDEATVQRWTWGSDTAFDSDGWERLMLEDGAAFDMVTGLATPQSPFNVTGGYFIVEGSIYSYQAYDEATGVLAGIQQVADDLTPFVPAQPGLAASHNRLHRLVPLSFITCSTLSAGIAAGAATIPLDDAGQFPQEGYVQIDDEIIAYSEKSGNDLVRDDAGFPRGAYNTAPAAHAVGAVVRHVPVRHLDRYRAGTDWAGHVAYTEVDLGGSMCMFSYSLAQPGQLSRVWWRFKQPLEDGQKVAVLVRIDGSPPAWNTNPDAIGDTLYGAISEGDGTRSGAIWPGGVPVTSGIEVRIYFDLGDTSPYGWSNMVEIDEVGVQMTPQPVSF